MPLRWLYAISTLVAFVLRSVLHYRRDVIIQNLSRSFPELKYKEIKSIANKFYKHFADVFTEVLKSISISRNNLRNRFKVENPELIIQYYKDNRNIIGLTGHIANWEWMSIIPSLYPFQCFTLYKPLHSKLAESLMTSIRRRFGMKLLSMTNAARFILTNKENKAFYIFIGDQSPAKVENATVFEFLHQPTTFFTGGAKLARATKAAVVYISIRKVKRGYYSVRFIPIVTPDLSASKEATSNVALQTSGMEGSNDIEKSILSSYARLLEADICANPVNWLWSHKRWKH